MQPLEASGAVTSPLYETFYGLSEQPFALSTDPRFLFLSASHRRAYEELLAGLRRREGLLLLTGETGTGKTTLSRAVVNALGPRTFSAFILDPYMTGAEVLRAVLRDFGLVSRDEIRRGAFERADAPQLLDTLEGFLRSLIPLEAHAVLVIDEAQSLSPDVLDRIRMLGAFEQDGQRLLQIILSGQPGLLDTLRAQPMRALSERITRRTSLAPLAAGDIGAYIAHRMGVAGRSDAVQFEPSALWLISELSQGVPRRINLLCDRTLEEGHKEAVTTIGAWLVKQAAKGMPGAFPDSPLTNPAEAAPATATETAPTPEEETDVDASRMPAPAWRLVAYAVGVLMFIAGLLGGYSVMSIASGDPGVPPPPKPPTLGMQVGTAPRPIPSDAEIAAPPTAPARPSGQLPDNRHQLD